MIHSMPTGSSISLDTRILDLPNLGFRRLGPITARKLAAGIAGISSGKDVNNVTVDDLLHYLPMRYEDRSKFTRIKDLSDGMEASLELFVKLSGGKQVGGWRRWGATSTARLRSLGSPVRFKGWGWRTPGGGA